MTHPRKKKRAREIRIDGEVFRWRFEPGAPGSELVVRHLGNGHAALRVTLPDWHDPWLFISGFTINPTTPQAVVVHTWVRNEPAAITPGFVARAIRGAMERGWDPASGHTSARWVYREGELRDFALVRRDSSSRVERRA